MKMKIMNGNIADMCADAIVLPANRELKEGRGCSTALFERAGRENLKAVCEKYVQEFGTFEDGDVIFTPAYELNAECLMHVVVPRWMDGNSDESANLIATYWNALEFADSKGYETIAFPLLASGNNGYDTELAFRLAQMAIEGFTPSNNLKTVYLVLYGERIVKYAKESGYDVCKVRTDSAQKKKEDKHKNVFLEMNQGEVVIKFLDFVEKHPEVIQLGKKMLLVAKDIITDFFMKKKIKKG